MNEKVKQLEERIKKLEDRLTARGIDNQTAEFFRDVIFVDSDSVTGRTISIGAGGGSAPALFDIYLRVYFRGKIYNIPAYNLL